MNITEKLKQSERIDNIYFYRERMFVQLYGISLYLSLKELGLPLNLRVKRYKMLGNRAILNAGMPLKSLLNLDITDLIVTDSGFKIPNCWSFDSLSYHNWYGRKLKQLLSEEEK